MFGHFSTFFFAVLIMSSFNLITRLYMAMALHSFSNLIPEEAGAYRSESVYVYKYPVIPDKKNINFNVMDEQIAMEKIYH